MDEMQEKYSPSFQENKQIMDTDATQNAPKKVDDILKEGLMNAQHHAQLLVHIINSIDQLNKRVEQLELYDKGKKRRIDE